jgi:flagella synthesis protein FlgN
MNSPLHDCLRREFSAVQAFVKLLDEEAKAMTDGNFASLPALAQRKSELADQITALGQQRELQQIELGYAAGRSGADAACAGGDKALALAWGNLLECAALARDCNHRNGVMIHTHLDFTRQTINFLQARGQPLYGPDGTHRTGSGSGNSLAVG